MYNKNMKNNKKFNLKQTTLFFIITMLIYFVLSAVVGAITSSTLSSGQDLTVYEGKIWHVLVSYSVFPLSFILSTLLFNFKNKGFIDYTLTNKSFNLKFLPIIIVFSFSILFGLSSLNEYFIDFLTDKFGYIPPRVVLPKKSFLGVLVTIFAIGILPAICEELFFRKIILNSMQTPIWFTVLTGGLLFSLFHLNPAQTPYQFVFGCVFVIVALSTKSVFATMIMHFINNTTIIVIYYSSWNGVLPIYIVIISLCAFLGCLIYFIFKLKNKKQENYSVKSGLFIFIPIALCLIIWLGALL